MSEFFCSQGHELEPGVGICPICGSGVAYMDGLSPEELKRDEMEAQDDEND